MDAPVSAHHISVTASSSTSIGNVGLHSRASESYASTSLCSFIGKRTVWTTVCVAAYEQQTFSEPWTDSFSLNVDHDNCCSPSCEMTNWPLPIFLLVYLFYVCCHICWSYRQVTVAECMDRMFYIVTVTRKVGYWFDPSLLVSQASEWIANW